MPNEKQTLERNTPAILRALADISGKSPGCLPNKIVIELFRQFMSQGQGSKHLKGHSLLKSFSGK